MSKHPAEIVLRALLRGIEVDYDGEPAFLDDNVLRTYLGTKYTIAVDPTLSEFILTCEKLSVDQVALVSMQLTLNRKGQ